MLEINSAVVMELVVVVSQRRSRRMRTREWERGDGGVKDEVGEGGGLGGPVMGGVRGMIGMESASPVVVLRTREGRIGRYRVNEERRGRSDSTTHVRV